MRYPVEARVSFWWTDEDGNRRQGEGSSRDVSETGTFVFAPGCPPVGSDVGLRILLVALPNATRDVHMEVEGWVLRVELATAGRDSSGFAVLTKEAILLENDESICEEDPSGNEAT